MKEVVTADIKCSIKHYNLLINGGIISDLLCDADIPSKKKKKKKRLEIAFVETFKGVGNKLKVLSP